ncbi:MAG: cupredoxin family copper-binding protein [Betaproteobacteria bacterium]|jgi:plastocyanin
MKFSRFRDPRLWLPTGLALLLCAAYAADAVYAQAATTGDVLAIDIAKFAFAPKDITVAPGTKIVWTNRDEAPHTVVSTDKSFVSKGLDTDDRFEQTFSREGDFAYVCSVHPFMTGVVHVHKP